MAIVGSVVDTQTVVTLTETNFTNVAFPEPNLTVVKVFTNGIYVGIPLDSSRRAIFPNNGGKATTSALTQIEGTGRPVTFQITGTGLNYFGLQKGTSLVTCFYYGTPLANALPATAYAGIVASSTLSTGSGTATFSFPSGNLTMTGFSANSTQTAATTILQATWATESGKTFNAFYPMNILTQSESIEDILAVNLTVAISVAVTLSLGTGSDVVYLFAFYK